MVNATKLALYNNEITFEDVELCYKQVEEQAKTNENAK